MKKVLFHAAIGVMLSGCTINQYGPSVLVGERQTEVSQYVEVDMKPGLAPVVREHPEKPKAEVVKPTVQRIVVPSKPKSKNCIPMPDVPAPPKLDVGQLSQYKNDQAKLEDLFRKNHNDLYNGWLKLKKDLDAWEKNPDRC
jgi:hypothetical protein